jgi:hypothetical protein
MTVRLDRLRAKLDEMEAHLKRSWSNDERSKVASPAAPRMAKAVGGPPPIQPRSETFIGRVLQFVLGR